MHCYHIPFSRGSPAHPVAHIVDSSFASISVISRCFRLLNCVIAVAVIAVNVAAAAAVVSRNSWPLNVGSRHRVLVETKDGSRCYHLGMTASLALVDSVRVLRRNRIKRQG